MAGLISGAMSGLGEGVQTAGKQLGKYAKTSALQAEMAELTKLRDERLNDMAVSMEKDVRQPFQTSERQAGQAFTAGENATNRTHQSTMQGAGFDHARGLQEAQQKWQGEQSALQRTLTREQMASSERIAAANRTNAMEIAKIGGTVQQDKEGNLLWFSKDGKATPIADPNNPGKSLQGFKDLSPAAKAYLDSIKAQLVDLDRMEVAAMNDQTQIAKIAERRAALTNEQLNVLTGGVAAAGKGAAKAPYAEGEELRGKDGNIYVVKGGQPVLKGAAGAKGSGEAPEQLAGPGTSGGREFDTEAEAVDPELKRLGDLVRSRSGYRSDAAYSSYKAHLQRMPERL